MDEQWTTEEIRLAWHDATCPEGPECRSRDFHALSYDSMVVALERFLQYLPSIVETLRAQVLEEAARYAEYHGQHVTVMDEPRSAEKWSSLRAQKIANGLRDKALRGAPND